VLRIGDFSRRKALQNRNKGRRSFRRNWCDPSR